MKKNQQTALTTGNIAKTATVGTLITVLPLLGSAIITYYCISNEVTITQFSPAIWLIISIVACLTCTFALTLPTPLALIIGYFLGWQALIPLFIINMVAIGLVNAIVRLLDRDRLQHWMAQQRAMATLLRRIRANELRVIFFAKLSPALPFTLTNVVFALSGARLRNVLLGGFLGMVPRTVLAVWTGREARTIQTLLADPNGSVVSRIVLAGLLLVSVVGMLSVFTRRFGTKPLDNLPD